MYNLFIECAIRMYNTLQDISQNTIVCSILLSLFSYYSKTMVNVHLNSECVSQKQIWSMIIIADSMELTTMVS